jgi:hypothetical protein
MVLLILQRITIVRFFSSLLCQSRNAMAKEKENTKRILQHLWTRKRAWKQSFSNSNYEYRKIEKYIRQLQCIVEHCGGLTSIVKLIIGGIGGKLIGLPLKFLQTMSDENPNLCSWAEEELVTHCFISSIACLRRWIWLSSMWINVALA